MTRTLQHAMRLVTLLIGMSATTVALAVATLEVTTTGPRAEETSIQLFDKDKVEVKPTESQAGPNGPRPIYRNLSGTYTVQAWVRNEKVGPPTTITLANGTYQLQVDSEQGVIPPAGTTPLASTPGTPQSEFSMSAGPNAASVGGIPYAETLSGTTEQALGRSPYTVYGAAIDANWRWRNGMQLNFGGMDGRHSSSAEVPIGQTTALTFFTPQSGFTGAKFTGGGGGADTTIKFSEFHINFTLPPQVLKDIGDALERSYWFGAPVVGVRDSQTKFNGSFSVLAAPTIWSTTELKVKEYDASAGYGVRGGHVFSNGLSGWGGVGADLIYYHASLNGNQAFVCPICNPAIQMLNITTSDSRNRLTWGVLASGGLSYPVSPSASIFFMAQYEYDFGVAKIRNNASPSDAGPGVDEGDRKLGSFQFGVSIKF